MFVLTNELMLFKSQQVCCNKVYHFSYIASPSKESYQSRVDQSDKTSTKEAATVKHQESKQSKAPKGTPTKQINNSKTKDMDDLSLDLGSVSEDDDSSTFDSTKLTPHREKYVGFYLFHNYWAKSLSVIRFHMYISVNVINSSVLHD